MRTKPPVGLQETLAGSSPIIRFSSCSPWDQSSVWGQEWISWSGFAIFLLFPPNFGLRTINPTLPFHLPHKILNFKFNLIKFQLNPRAGGRRCWPQGRRSSGTSPRWFGKFQRQNPKSQLWMEGIEFSPPPAAGKGEGEILTSKIIFIIIILLLFLIISSAGGVKNWSGRGRTGVRWEQSLCLPLRLTAGFGIWGFSLCVFQAAPPSF